MPALFVNYRVGETAAFARLLDGRCAAAFGRHEVFFASEAITPGMPFDAAIEEALRSCEALVAVIGPHWYEAADPRGGRRLDYQDDWVRLEIATALARAIPVIPVLIDNADLPKADRLPADISGLPVRHQVRVGHRAGDPDLDTVVAAVRRAVPRLDSAYASHACSFAVVEIDGFEQQDPDEQACLKQELSAVVAAALNEEQVDWSIIRTTDGGNGLVLRIPDSAKPVATLALTRSLHRILAQRAGSGAPGGQLRLRVALQADERPGPGTVRRLVGASVVRRVLAEADRSHLVVVASQSWWEDGVHRAESRIDSDSCVRVRLGSPESEEIAWIHVPGLSRPPGIAQHEVAPTDQPAHQAAPGARTVTFNGPTTVGTIAHGDVTVNGGVTVGMPAPRRAAP